ncbi:MAG: hypothetical protein VX941_00765 [Pseudomonadota bacterium]|nr:hypothetical protein [Pseudomonadota bacterium]
MRTPIIISVLLHLSVVLLGWAGLPAVDRPIIEPEQIIEIEVVSELEAKKPGVEKELPKKRSTVSAAPRPSLPPSSAEAAAVPLPSNMVEKKASKKPVQPAPRQKAEERSQPKSPPRPRMKPKAPPRDLFASVLKSVEKLEKKKPAEKKKQVKAFDKNILNVLEKHKSVAANRKPNQLASILGRVTQNDKDAIRRQIERCWNPPVGAKNAEELTVELRLYVTPDGTVQTVNVIDKARAASDPYFRAAVESAYRAVLNPRCRQLKFPLDKYEQFKTMTIVFDPREMLGR